MGSFVENVSTVIRLIATASLDDCTEHSILVVSYDASKPIGTSAALIDAVVKHFGQLDGLVLNHISSPFHPVETSKDKLLQQVHEFDSVMHVNFIAYVELALCALPYLRESTLRHSSSISKWTSQILFLTSAAAYLPAPNILAYGSSKSAVSTFSNLLRAELQCSPNHNNLVKIDSIILGAIDSEGFQGTPLAHSERVRSTLRDSKEAAWKVVRAGMEGMGRRWGGRGSEHWFPWCEFAWWSGVKGEREEEVAERIWGLSTAVPEGFEPD